jgi:UDPglucose 6-dehydrogenase
VARGQDAILVVQRESAELAKYAANAFLAMKITFINEIADLCERVGSDVYEVAAAIGRDSRIGDKFLQPGPGFGGSCFPKDVSAIIRTARENRAPLAMMEAVQHLNDERKIDMARRIREALPGGLDGTTIAVLGVTFKAHTDDIREAAALTILPILADEGAVVQAYDPQGQAAAERLLPDVEWCRSSLEAADRADALIVLTEWPEFGCIDLTELRKRMRGRVIVDLRCAFDPAQVEAAGFEYFGLGRSRRRSTSRSVRPPMAEAPVQRPGG